MEILDVWRSCEDPSDPTVDTESESTLKVIEDLVKFTSKATGKSEMVGAGEMIAADEEGLQKKPFDIEEEGEIWKDPVPSSSVTKDCHLGLMIAVIDSYLVEREFVCRVWGLIGRSF